MSRDTEYRSKTSNDFQKVPTKDEPDQETPELRSSILQFVATISGE